MRFSIIVPFFNTPISLFQMMIDSVLSQTYEDFEVLIINDGSNSKNRHEIDVFKDRRIKIIDQENHGVSNARNVGVSLAKGEYILFVDADDFISKDCLFDANEIISRFNPDVIYGKFVITNLNKDKIIPGTNKDTNNQGGSDLKFYKSQEDLNNIKLDMLNVYPRQEVLNLKGSVWGRVFRRDLIKGIRFSENIKYGEDQLFNREVLKKCPYAIVTPYEWYFYVQNDFSVMHKNLRKINFDKYFPFWNELNKMHDMETNQIKPYLNIYYLNLYYGFIDDVAISNENIFAKLRKLRLALNHPLIRRVYNEEIVLVNKKIKIKWWLVKHKLYMLEYIRDRFKIMFL